LKKIDDEERDVASDDVSPDGFPVKRSLVVAELKQIVTEIIGEDAAEFLDFTETSRFILDLEMDSIQLIHLIECASNLYGERVNFVKWLSAKPVGEILALTVGDVARFVEESVREGTS
jgi:acyl carrier protein